MRKITSSFAALSLLCLLNITPAIAHENGEVTEHVKFNDNILVNDTVVKSGEYKLVFEPETSMLKIKKGNKIVAQTRAAMKVNPQKAERDYVYTRDTLAGKALEGVKFGGQHEEVMVEPSDENASVTYFYFEEL